MDAREPYAIQIQFLAMRFTSIVVNSRLKSCSVSLFLSLLKTSLFATRSVYIQADQKLAILLFLLFILSLYGQIRWRNERENGFGKKTRHLGGLAAIQSYFLLASFSFLALPSRSSVHSAIYTVPALSCHPYIHSFVSFRVTIRDGGDEKRKRDEYIEWLSQSVNEMIGCERFFSTSFYFIGCNLPLYFICSRLSRDSRRL